MKRATKPTPAAETARKQAVIYARVSSKEQEKEGFSIPAQLKLLKEYAAANGFAVAQEYIDVETAKQTGRAAFGEMVAYLKAHPSVRVMLVEKTDRLYRNLKDWVTVDELDVEIHFPKEGVVLSRDSRSSEKFMHGIKVLMAKNYIDNLSEEARKGMTEKAEQGIWPSNAPLGYRNVTGPGRQKDHRSRREHRADHSKLVRMVCARRHFDHAKRRRRRGPLVSSFRKSGGRIPGEHSCNDPAQPALYRSVRMERQDISGASTSRSCPVELWERVQDVLDGRIGQQGKNAKTGFRLLGADRVRRLRLRRRGRDQEGALRLLSLHRICR